MRYRRLSILLTGLLLLISAAVVSAGGKQGPEIVAFPQNYDCDGYSVTFTGDGLIGTAFGTVTLDGEVIDEFEIGFEGSFTVSGVFVPPLVDTAHSLVIEGFVPLPQRGNTNSIPFFAAGRFDCEGSSGLVGGRVCFGPGEVDAAVFITATDLEIWAIGPDDGGQLALSISKDDLFAQWVPGVPTKVAEVDLFIHIELWMQANGFPRIVAGPDSEGKIFECVFGARYSRVRSFFPGGVGPDEVIPDEPTPTPTPDVK